LILYFTEKQHILSQGRAAFLLGSIRLLYVSGLQMVTTITDGDLYTNYL